VRLGRRTAGLTRDSVVHVSQLITVDKTILMSRIGRISAQTLRDVDAGLRLVLSL
jgi:mRNA interferase MazF